MKDYRSVYHKVIFKNLEEERKKKTYRFSLSYSFHRSDYFPMKICLTDPFIFNYKYIKDLGIRSDLPPKNFFGRNSMLYIQKTNNHLFAVIPRFRFDPPFHVLINEINKVYGIPSGRGSLDELYPGDIFGAFSQEKGHYMGE